MCEKSRRPADVFSAAPPPRSVPAFSSAYFQRRICLRGREHESSRSILPPPILLLGLSKCWVWHAKKRTASTTILLARSTSCLPLSNLDTELRETYWVR